MQKIRFEEPIEVIHLMTDAVRPAKFLNEQTLKPGWYEIEFDGHVWAVRPDDIVNGRIDQIENIAPDFQVRNQRRQAD